MIIYITIASFIATLLGGLFALKFKDKLHLILGFSAGAVIGVAFFDLIPESIEIGSGIYDISSITFVTAIGFIIYMILDRTIFFHSHDDEHNIQDEYNKNSLALKDFYNQNKTILDDYSKDQQMGLDVVNMRKKYMKY